MFEEVLSRDLTTEETHRRRPSTDTSKHIVKAYLGFETLWVLQG